MASTDEATARTIGVRVISFLKPGVLDAEGRAVEEGLAMLGYRACGVRVGRAVELWLPEAGWREAIEAICRRFLVNPLIESYRWERIESRRPAQGAP